MKKQNIAVFLSSLMLLAILVPSMVAAQLQQEGDLVLTGATDLFFQGYDPAGNAKPGTVNFQGRTTSSSDQTTTLNYTHGSWIAEQFIGVMDLDADTYWNVNVSASKDFAGGGKTFETDLFGIKTSGAGFAGAVSITCANPTDCSVILTQELDTTHTNNVYHYVPTGAGYEYLTTADVTAPRNVDPATFNWVTDAYDSLLGGATPLLVNGIDKEAVVGYYGVGVNFKVNIPGGTPAGTYTGTITYDLTVT